MKKIKGLSFYRRRKKINSSHIKDFFSWMFGILTAIFIAVVLNLFFGTTTEVVGVSMEPTLYNGQTIFINSFVYVLSSPKEGDVVVFFPNGNEKAHYYVKRVVATSGDTVEIRDGVLYVNGEESTWITDKILDGGIASNPITIGNGQVFCIGDNPGDSEDSRSANIGPVSEEDIIGKVWFRAPYKDLGMGFVK